MISCESAVSNETENINESFKKIDFSLCDSLKFGKFNCKFPRELTISNGRKHGELISFSNKYKEIYSTIFELNLSSAISDSLFKVVTNEQIEKFKQPLNGNIEVKEDYQSIVNGWPSRYYRITGRSYGFPLKQSISLRFIRFNKEIVFIHSWMMQKDFETYEWMEDVIASTLKK